jgi:hypothetical protein
VVEDCAVFPARSNPRDDPPVTLAVLACIGVAALLLRRRYLARTVAAAMADCRCYELHWLEGELRRGCSPVSARPWRRVSHLLR